MEPDEMEARIHDLEAQISSLQDRIRSFETFTGVLIGRLVAAKSDAPDLGLPIAQRHTEEYQGQLTARLAFNNELGR